MTQGIKKMCRVLLSLALVLSSLVLPTSAKEENSLELGATVLADETSPSGYTVNFVYDASLEEKEIKSVSVTGPFQYVDSTLELKDKDNAFTPHEYQAGMYASNCAPGPFTWGYTEEMLYDAATDTYQVSFPITSGSFAYSYIIEYLDGTKVTIDDPANPSPAKLSPNSDSQTGDITHSIVYGKYDEVKQAGSPNLDMVLPSTNYGQLTYVEYQGVLSNHQDMGIYVPSNYDENREEPYKVVYASHGGGGNETDWFAMGHVDNIVENLGADVIVVTMDNSSFGWNFEKIEDNVLNYIIPYMEAHYNVSKEVNDRAFCGLSMGSMTTMHMYFDYPEAFGYFGSFSGTDMNAIRNDTNINSAKYYMTVGTCDIASELVMPNDNPEQLKKYEDFIHWENENELINFVDGGYIPGAHDWFVWSSSFATFLDEICWTEKENVEVTDPDTSVDDEDKPTQNPSDSITTGDEANILPYMMISLTSISLLGALIYTKHTQKENQI